MAFNQSKELAVRVPERAALHTPTPTRSVGAQILRLLVLLLFSIPAFAAPNRPYLYHHTAPSQGPRWGVSVKGNALWRHGERWLPGGVNLRALERARPSPVGPVSNRQFLQAEAYYGPLELHAVRGYGANTVRFQISQPGLDRKSPGYVPAYLHRIIRDVHEAQAAGLTVVLAMQWERAATGVSGSSSMPDASTARAWARLAPVFSHDTDVMYELFNEPILNKNVPLAQRWHAWTQAFQPLINEIRDIGARNVLIIDGMRAAHTLQHAPTLFDPIGQLAYAVHPYPTRGEPVTPSGWNIWFGNFARTHPVIVTEWYMASKYPHFCLPHTPAITRAMLGYTLKHRIGLIVGAFDVPGIVLSKIYFQPAQYFEYTLTTFQHFHCGRQYDNGPGYLFQDLYLNKLPVQPLEKPGWGPPATAPTR